MAIEEIKYQDEAIAALRKAIGGNEKNYNMDMIDRAIAIACEAHAGQKRYSGGDYVCHPLQVACILVELGMDNEAIVAAILHDVVEDTSVELEEVR